MRDVAPGHPELMSRWKLFEHGHGLKPRVHRLFTASDIAKQAGKGAERVGFLEAVTSLAVAVERPLLGLERIVHVTDQVAGVRPALEQLGLLLRAKVIGEAQRASILGGGLREAPSSPA